MPHLGPFRSPTTTRVRCWFEDYIGRRVRPLGRAQVFLPLIVERYWRQPEPMSATRRAWGQSGRQGIPRILDYLERESATASFVGERLTTPIFDREVHVNLR